MNMAYEIKQDGSRFLASNIKGVGLDFPQRPGDPFEVVVFAPKELRFKRPTVKEARAVAARISNLWARHG
jgi:hypothetical protein